MTRTAGKSELLAIAVWAATLFGLLEGVAQCISRRYPLIMASKKVSTDVLWVAPLVNLPVFVAVALLCWGLLAVAGRRLRGHAEVLPYGVLAFTGFYEVLTMPQMIHRNGAAMLSLGLAVVLSRMLQGREPACTEFLRRRLLWAPLLILAAALLARGDRWSGEALQARALPPGRPGAPNVLVIVLDTVRADDFSRPGKESLVPNLDRLAARGVRFINAWTTSSWSLPSQVSILTGLYAHEHQGDWPRARMKSGARTLAGYLGRRGYASGAFSSNAAWVTPEYMERGFLRFEAYQLEDLARRTVYGRKLDQWLNHHGYHYAGRGKPAPRLNAQFLEFLDDYPNRPFFAYVCYMDVNRTFHNRRFNYPDSDHVPAQAIVEAYDGGLKELDRHVGDLLEELRRRGLLEKTIVVVTSDHGESFGLENPGDHEAEGHGSSVYPEQAQVPLILAWPGHVPAGAQVSDTVTIRQIPATVTGLLGMAESPFDGPPLSAAWEHSGTAGDSTCVLATVRHLDGQNIQRSVICGHWQFIHTPRDFQDVKKGDELFDLARDPRAAHNLAGAPETQPIVERMRAKLQQMLAAPAKAPPKSPAGPSGKAAGRSKP